MVCLAGCGEWYPRSAFERAWSQITSHTSVVEPPPWPWLPAPCAVCRQAMLVGYKQELRYDFCATHGVWLDAGEVDRFTELFESR